MKWFFCWCQDSDFRDDHNWKDLIRASVESAKKNTFLEPNFIYDGNPSDFTEELAAKGVNVIFHRLSFTDQIIRHNPKDRHFQAIARGAFLRFDIPILADETSEFVLYTDADVLFLKNETYVDCRPSLIAAGPQFSRGDKHDMNSGVMLINLPEFRKTYDRLIDFTIKNLTLGLDQEILRVFLGTDYTLLPDINNWKPYWGVNADASILHWHGPKPETVNKLLKNSAELVNDTWKILFERDKQSYDHYLQLHNHYVLLQRQSTASRHSSLVTSITPKGKLPILTRCTEILGAHNVSLDEPPIEEHYDVLCIPPSETNQRAWGIFGADQRLISSTGYYRGVGDGRYLPMQEESTNFDVSTITNFAPDDVYFYGGKLHPHYSHFLLSSLSRFWPIMQKQMPTCKILMHEGTNPDHWFSFPHLAFCFEQLGLRRSDFVNFGEPVKIRKLIVAQPSFEEERLAYPVFAKFCNQIGKKALDGRQLNESLVPVYLSKSKLKSGVWRFVNEDAVASILSNHGVDIIFPEKLEFSEQIKTFMERKIILGTMSSTLHTSIFSSNHPEIIGLNYNQRVESNYTMSDEINGVKGQYLYPKNGVIDLGPGEDFTANYRILSPQQVADDLLKIIDSKIARLNKNAAVSFGLPTKSNISLRKKATQSSICQWSLHPVPQDDAAGAINGIKNGRQGFHTEIEDSPWWLVDLGNIYGIHEIKLFNRMDIPGVAERSARIAIDVGLKEDEFIEIHRREEDFPFGGVDGDPLIVEPLIPYVGRFVRIRLLERNYLHLDQVEVYGELLGFLVSDHLF